MLILRASGSIYYLFDTVEFTMRKATTFEIVSKLDIISNVELVCSKHDLSVAMGDISNIAMLETHWRYKNNTLLRINKCSELFIQSHVKDYCVLNGCNEKYIYCDHYWYVVFNSADEVPFIDISDGTYHGCTVIWYTLDELGWIDLYDSYIEVHDKLDAPIEDDTIYGKRSDMTIKQFRRQILF